MVRTKGYPEALEKKLHDQRYYREDSNPEFHNKSKGNLTHHRPHVLPVRYLHRVMPVRTPKHLPDPPIYAESGARA